MRFYHGGSQNTATGYYALNNTSATNNTADGYQALFSANVGTENTASGHNALFSNTSGNQNTANGTGALQQHHRQRQHGHRLPSTE